LTDDVLILDEIEIPDRTELFVDEILDDGILDVGVYDIVEMLTELVTVADDFVRVDELIGDEELGIEDVIPLDNVDLLEDKMKDSEDSVNDTGVV
jgi:hypothetical protein